MTINQLTNILTNISEKDRSKDFIKTILEEKLDKSNLNFEQNHLDKNRVIFIYNGYKYKIAINSKGLLSNFIESKNFSLIKSDSLKEYNKFISELELFELDNKKFQNCNYSYISSYYRKQNDFKLIRSTISNVTTFNSIKYDSNLYFYFKVFIELTKKYMSINSMNSYDFEFKEPFFKFNNFLNIYPKSITKNIKIDFNLETFLNNPNTNFFNETEYKIILNNYENDFNNLSKNSNYGYNSSNDNSDSYDDDDWN